MAEIAARVYRGKTVEAVHYATIVVIDETGALTYRLGNPDLIIMTRSSIKPFQLMPLFVTGGVDRFQFSPKQLAIMCGSHNGTSAHREVVEHNLRASGHTPEHLQCGSHRPMFMEGRGEFPSHGEELDQLRHNCSGKHSGFLALAKQLNDPPHEYLNPGSRAQAMVRQIVAEYCEYPEEQMTVGIDGCSAPNVSMPLANLARGYQKLVSGVPSKSVQAESVKRICDAMMAHPVMVSGEGRLDYDLARSFPGRLICKVGAEGTEVIGLTDPPIGIGVKVHDGSFRPLGPICVRILELLGVIDNIENFPHLAAHRQPIVRNARNIETGTIVSDFELEKVTS